MNPDGWIVIGSKMDSSQLEKDLRKMENELKKYEKETTKLTEKEAKIKVKMELDEEDFKRKQKKLTQRQEIEYRANEKFGIIKNQDQIDAKYASLRQELNAQYAKTLDKNDATLDDIHQKMEENTREQQRLNEEIEQTSVELQKANKNFDLKGTLNNIGNSIQSITKKVARWGLALFGIRSGYMFIRQAMSVLAQYDQQLATDIQYIKFALAMTLERVIKPIVDWVYRILQYVNYLTMAWFNLNLFGKATVSAFQKTNKQAQKLQKTLAGFDEMNILNDNTGNEDSGIFAPSTDLSSMKDFKPPKWLEWIKDHGEEIKNIIIAIGVALGMIKFAELLVAASELTGALGLLGQIGLIIIGVELLYTALTGRELISDIKEIIQGLKDLEEIRKKQNAQAKTTKTNTQKLINTYNEAAKAGKVTTEQTKDYVDTLLNGIRVNDNLVDSMEKQKNWLGELNGDNKKLTKTQKEYNETIDIQLEELKKLYDAGKLNNKQKALYISAVEKQTQKLVDENDKLNKNSEEYKNNAKKIQENKTELENLTGKKYEVRPTITPLNTSALETELRNFFDKLQRAFGNLGELKIGFGWGNGGGGFRAKGGIYYPKLAAGGIINRPGSGVPYHGATIGERGAEAVVPLTDSQQMALLGEAIGKYITVNATVINSMNGRVLSREIQKVQNESNFAMNR